MTMASVIGVKNQPRPVDSHVGSRIRLRRKMIGMSQETLAGRIGLTFQQVQKYERGTNRVGASRLQQIADALETTPAWFFEGASSAAESPTGNIAGQAADAVYSAFLEDPLAAPLMRGFVKLRPTLKRRIVELVAAAGEEDVLE
jgi:transcriptional regulator with XRE-family HTH domain